MGHVQLKARPVKKLPVFDSRVGLRLHGEPSWGATIRLLIGSLDTSRKRAS